MKIREYAVAFASVSLFAQAIALPGGQYGKDLTMGERRGAKKGSRSKSDPSKNKYFHEPGGDAQLGHYDARYFHGVVSYEERTDTQLHMIRAYLKFFKDQGLDTWIAHGTLLGWWWNGKRLPWDWDMDTQVSAATLHYMGGHFNQSRQQYVSDDGQTKREYLLDVNPWIWERERGDGMNIIDARWIDVRNGLFIDITGLSETHPDTHPGTWVCKNYHRYHISDLFPMRESMFEGVPANIPYAYDKILIEEYKEKALVLTEYEDHVWDPNQKEWVKAPKLIEEEKKKLHDDRKAKEDAVKKDSMNIIDRLGM